MTEYDGRNSEEWRPVVGFEAVYEVSDHGRIRRIATQRILKPSVTSRGYAIVNLVDASRNLRRCSHVYNIVTAAFLGPKPAGLCVNHRDGVKVNNRLSNLEYVTYQENSRHAIETGLVPRKFTLEQVLEVRALKGRVGAIRAARMTNMSNTSVFAIWDGKRYTDYE